MSTRTPLGHPWAPHGHAGRPDGAAGEHRCVRDARCAAAERDTESNRLRGATTPTANTLCDGCGERVRRAHHHMPRAYVELETLLDHHTRARVKVHGTPDPPIPPRLDILTLQADLDHHLSTWAPPIAHALGIGWDTHRMAAQRPGPRLARAAHLLALHTVLLLRLGPTPVTDWIGGPVTVTRTGTDAALRALHLHQRAHLLTTGGSGDARLPVPCPSCEGVLIRRNGMDHVQCQNCPRTWPEDHYRRLCLILAQDYRDITGKPA